MRQCSGPIYFSRPSKKYRSGVKVINNGSFGLVDTGKRKLMVTCQHVWADFCKKQKRIPTLTLSICAPPGVLVDLKSIQPIDQNKALDLATFDMEPYLDQCPESEFSQLRHIHLQRVRPGDPIVFTGYPGRIDGNTAIGTRFRRQAYAVFAHDVSHSRIVVDMSGVMTYGEKPGPRKPLPGVSGSPCYLLRPNMTMELVAFASEEGQKGLQDILLLSRTTSLNTDGTFGL
jgi:hypothetical protein